MSFEEDFPSLKRFNIDHNKLFLSTYDIMECCLDKEKVREAIDTAIRFTQRYNKDSNNYECEMRLNDLKKELGL